MFGWKEKRLKWSDLSKKILWICDSHKREKIKKQTDLKETAQRELRRSQTLSLSLFQPHFVVFLHHRPKSNFIQYQAPKTNQIFPTPNIIPLPSFLLPNFNFWVLIDFQPLSLLCEFWSESLELCNNTKASSYFLSVWIWEESVSIYRYILFTCQGTEICLFSQLSGILVPFSDPLTWSTYRKSWGLFLKGWILV